MEQTWVGKLGEARRRWAERQKAAEAAKWEDLNNVREWIRQERRKLQLSVDNSTAALPPPPENPRARKAKVDRLNEQVWHTSYWLLIAAAIGKQYLKASTVVPEATSGRGLINIEFMARAFRNWINRVRVNQQPPGSDYASDSDDTSNTRVIKAMARRAVSVGPESDNEEDANSEVSDGFEGLPHLDPNDVSDEILVAVSTMMYALKSMKGVEGDWADFIFMNVAKILFHGELPMPSRSEPDVEVEVEVVKDAQSEPAEKAKELLLGTARTNKKRAAKSNDEISEERMDKPKHKSRNHGQQPSYRRPNEHPPPSPSVYDPSLWRVNTMDPDDGVWASEVTGHRQPTKLMEIETGFMTWDEQEAKFPLLVERLRLHSVEAPQPMVFDPATVDTRIWDPLNRAVAESTKGRRSPLRLNPVTIHSLSRWAVSEFSTEVPLDPLRLPGNPPVEVKRRPLSSSTLSVPRPINKQTNARLGTAWGSVKRGKNTVAFSLNTATPTTTVPTKETPAALTDQPAALASIHYPLKSPTATSISALYPERRRTAIERSIYEGGFANLANIKPSPPGPPTPFPTPAVISPITTTPTVALYEEEPEPQLQAPGGSGNGNGEKEDYDNVTFIEQVRPKGRNVAEAKLAAFVKGMHHTAAAPGGSGGTLKRRSEGKGARERNAKTKRVTYLQKNAGRYSDSGIGAGQYVGSGNDNQKEIRRGSTQQQQQWGGVVPVGPRQNLDAGLNQGGDGEEGEATTKKQKKSPLSRVVTIEDVPDAGEPIITAPVTQPPPSPIFIYTAELPSPRFGEQLQVVKAKQGHVRHQHQNRHQHQQEKKKKTSQLIPRVKAPTQSYPTTTTPTTAQAQGPPTPPPSGNPPHRHREAPPTPKLRLGGRRRSLPPPGERRSVRFKLEEDSGPNRGMLQGARRAIHRYDATTARVGPLGTIPDRERIFDVDL